jgi:hypothetical protein
MRDSLAPESVDLAAEVGQCVKMEPGFHKTGTHRIATGCVPMVARVTIGNIQMSADDVQTHG